MEKAPTSLQIYFRWHIDNNKERGVLGARVSFYTWREFVTVVARYGTCD